MRKLMTQNTNDNSGAVRHNNTEESVLYYKREYHNNFTLPPSMILLYFQIRALTKFKAQISYIQCFTTLTDICSIIEEENCQHRFPLFESVNSLSRRFFSNLYKQYNVNISFFKLFSWQKKLTEKHIFFYLLLQLKNEKLIEQTGKQTINQNLVQDSSTNLDQFP